MVFCDLTLSRLLLRRGTQERTKDKRFIIISLRNNMFELCDRLVGIYKTDNVTKSITIDPRKFAVPHSSGAASAPGAQTVGTAGSAPAPALAPLSVNMRPKEKESKREGKRSGKSASSAVAMSDEDEVSTGSSVAAGALSQLSPATAFSSTAASTKSADAPAKLASAAGLGLL